MPLGRQWGPMSLGPLWAPPKSFEKESVNFLKSKIAQKAYIPPTLFKMKFHDIESKFKVYIPIFQPPGHYFDDFGQYYDRFDKNNC